MASIRPKALLGNLALLFAGLAFAGLALELALRFVPGLLPAGNYGAGVLSEDLGMGVHGGPVRYNKVRRVTRLPNEEGFLDVDHEVGKPPGTLRIGFFGDSYVEAAQVELEQTFFRVLPSVADGAAIETFGFGISGWGTLHGFLAHQRYGPRYDLDYVVYVFVENDPGDNMFEIKKGAGASSLKPLAVLSDSAPGFELRWLDDPGTPPSPTRALLKAIQRHSLLAQVVQTRLSLLRMEGLRARADARDVEMSGKAGAVPAATDLPDTWPPAYRERAEALAERILVAWQRDVRARGAELVVLYVPRGRGQLLGEVPLASTWRPWLGDVTRRLGIPLIDPSPRLAQREQQGVATYDDHFTPEGHAVIAETLASWSRRRAPSDIAAGAR